MSAQPAASARPVRPSPSAPRCSSAQGADTRAPIRRRALDAAHRPPVRDRLAQTRPGCQAGEASPILVPAARTTTHPVDMGPRGGAQSLSCRVHWLLEDSPALGAAARPAVRERQRAGEASQPNASVAKHDSPHSRPISTASSRARCRRRDAREWAISPQSHPLIRVLSDGSTERRRRYGGAVSDPASSSASAQSSLGAPSRGGHHPAPGTRSIPFRYGGGSRSRGCVPAGSPPDGTRCG